MHSKQEFLKRIKKPEDKFWYSKALEQAYSCIKTSDFAFTDFSDPLKIGEVVAFLKDENKFSIKAYGGFDNSERLMLGFYPAYLEMKYSDFPIKAIKIEYNEKFSKNLTHRDFLGSILGLGIKREKIGDILAFQGYCIVFVEVTIADYISYNLEKVRHTKVKSSIVQPEKLADIEVKMEERTIIISSLRLDAVVSGAFGISRSKAAELINADKAFLNWQNETNTSKSVSEGDILTLRGTGRIKVDEIAGKTKKDRIVLNITKFT